MRTYAIHRQDSNDDDLVNAARDMGCIAIKFPPLDYWIWWTGLSTHWVPMDVKDPKKKGWASEFTTAQQRFIQQCNELGARFEIWRTLDDVENSRSYAFAKARAL
jgi:hypothetical protein